MSDYREHPENDLETDADYTNLRPPEPLTFDELADAPDPAVLAARNAASTRQALWYSAAVVTASLAVALAFGLGFRFAGGPRCDSGEGSWLCTDTALVVWGLIVLVVPICGMLGCAGIMLHKLRTYVRWRPWMGAFWGLAMWAMAWMLCGLQMVLLAQA